MNKTILQEYAKLIARCGVNVQKGQEVLINCGLDQPEFVAMVVRRPTRPVPVRSPSTGTTSP